jgi:hypothetical protein
MAYTEIPRTTVIMGVAVKITSKYHGDERKQTGRPSEAIAGKYILLDLV